MGERRSMKTVGLVTEYHVEESGWDSHYRMSIQIADPPTLTNGETLMISWSGEVEDGKVVDVEWTVEPQEPQP